MGVGGWRHSRTGRLWRGFQSWRQCRERGDGDTGGSVGREVMVALEAGLRGLHAAGKVLEAWTAKGGFVPLWRGRENRDLFLV